MAIWVSGPMDWAGLSSPDKSRDLYADCLRRGLIGPGERERVRWWTARAAALRTGRNPMALMAWLLKNPESAMACCDEEQGMQDARGQRVTTGNSDVNADPLQISEILAQSGLPKHR